MNTSVEDLDRALRLLSGHLRLMNADPIHMVVCGGAALLARQLIGRPTQDVDLVAFLDEQEELISPSPFPDALEKAAHAVAKTLDLPLDWLNNAASCDEAGLFQRGLPAGLQSRLIRRDYGDAVHAYFISRLDQIHFKLLAAVNVGGRHLTDLMQLHPKSIELEQAARWTILRDNSEPFVHSLKSVLESLGYVDIAEKLPG
ncbi:MAG: hypothetical protein KAH38_10250 [Candidatus Hydrogenedentes bacterium]|nr:hypothetical protein [Candidatus Hydrogenedentota bacterium]